MSVEDLKKLSPTDPELIDRIVSNIKARGIFDQFRKDCLADVDTKPAYQNLQQRVNGTVRGYLGTRKWNPSLNKNQLRENLRKYTVEQPYLEVGVDRIVDQVVNPKMYSVFMPKIEDIVYEMLGIEKPKPKPLFPNYKNYTNNQIPQQSTPSKNIADPSAPPGPSTSPPPITRAKTPEPVKVEEIKDENDLIADSVDGSKSDMSYSPIAVKDEIKEEVEEEGPNAKANENDDEMQEIKTPEAPVATNNEDDSNTIDEMPLLAASMDADSNQASLSALDSTPQTCNTKSETGGQPEFADERSLTPRPPADFDTLTNNLSSLKSEEKISPSKKFDNFSNLDEKLKQADVNLRETSNKKAAETEESSELTKSSSDRSDSESTNSKIDHSESNTSLENNRPSRSKRRILSDSSGESNSESINKVKPSDSEDGQSSTGPIVDKHSANRSPVTDKRAKCAEVKKDKEKSSSSRSADAKSKVNDDAKEKIKHDDSRHRSDKHKSSHRSEKNDSHKEKNDKDKSEHRHDKIGDADKKDSSSKKRSEKSRKDDDKGKTGDSKKNEDSLKHDKGKHRSSEKVEDKHKRDRTEHKSKSSSSRDESKKREDKSKDENIKDKESRDKKSDKRETNGDKSDKKPKEVDDKKKSSKKKGGHCDEDDSKTRNSRRSSDRDSNGGAGSSSAPKHNSSSNNSTSNSKKSSSKSDKGRSKHKSSSSKESVDDVSEGQTAGKEVDEVDLFLMQISESIDEEQESACRKPKTASNFSEMRKIMEARKSCRRSTSFDAEDPDCEGLAAYQGEFGFDDSEGENLDSLAPSGDDAGQDASNNLMTDALPADDIKAEGQQAQSSESGGLESCYDVRNPTLIGILKPCVMINDVMSGPMGKKLQEFGYVHMGNAGGQSSSDNPAHTIPVPEIKQSDDVPAVPKSLSSRVDIAETKALENILAPVGPSQPQDKQVGPSVLSPREERITAKDEATIECDNHAQNPNEACADVPINASDDGSSDAVPRETAKVPQNQVTATPKNIKKDLLLEASTSSGKLKDPETNNQPVTSRTRRKNAGSLMYAVLEGLNEKLVVNKRVSNTEAGSPATKKKCIRNDKMETSVNINDKSMPAGAEILSETFDQSDISNKENNQGHASNKMPRIDASVNSEVKIVEPRLTRKRKINSPADEESLNIPRLRVSLAVKKAESKSRLDVLAEDSAKLDAYLPSPVSISAKSAECLNEKPSSEPMPSQTPDASASSILQRRQSCPSIIHIGGLECEIVDAGGEEARVSSTLAVESSDAAPDADKKSDGPDRNLGKSKNSRRQSIDDVATRKSNRNVLSRSNVRKNSTHSASVDSPGGLEKYAKRSDSESSGEISCNSESSGQTDAQPNRSTDSGYVDGPIVNPAEIPVTTEVINISEPPSSSSTSDKENKLEIIDEIARGSAASDSSIPETVPNRNPKKTDQPEDNTSSSDTRASSSNVSSLTFANPPEPLEFLNDSDDEFKGFPPVNDDDEKMMRLFERFHPNSSKVAADRPSSPAEKELPPISPMRTRKKKCLVDRGENQSNDIERRTDALKLTLVSRSITPGKNGIIVKRSQTPVTNVKAPSNLRKRNSQTGPLDGDKQKKLRNTQSYSATDLYKPRPSIGRESNIAVGPSPANKRLKKGPR